MRQLTPLTSTHTFFQGETTTTLQEKTETTWGEDDFNIYSGDQRQESD